MSDPQERGLYIGRRGETRKAASIGISKVLRRGRCSIVFIRDEKTVVVENLRVEDLG